jgi:hypothetical protein
VREHLNTHFPGRWTGTAEPIAWPPRSPDLKLLDFIIITISHDTQSVLLHYDSPKHSTCSLNKCI